MNKNKKIYPVKSSAKGRGAARPLFNRVKIVLDNKKVLAKEGQTILEVAKKKGIEIPSLCFHPDLEIKENCRLCLVEIKGEKELKTACSTQVQKGMEITTSSPKIYKARKFNLELIFSQHVEECDDCVFKFNCQLLNLAKKYNVKITRFKDRKTKRPIFQFGPIVFDQTKCMDCRNCEEVCPVDFLEIKDQGAEIKIEPSKEKDKDCVACGQCLVHCPVGAIESTGEFESIKKPLKQKDKIVVAQFAPALRSSLGEEFGLAFGSIITGQLVAGLKKIGFNKVFDTSVGADFTTVEEAQELKERLRNKKNLPMFTSCCPAWVKFIEFYYPEFIKNLTTVRSPHIILGGLIKTFWPEKEKINPKKIVVVSIMPCTAKKYEIERKELKINGLKPVDYVLTTREIARLFKIHKIDLEKLKPEKTDHPLGLPSGAGVIYGSSGGVMESVLRTVYEKLTGKKLLRLNFKQVRGEEGIKEAEISNHHLVKVAVVNGLGNAKIVLEKLKKNPKAYDYIEVMACEDGCVGGGGQPMPVDKIIRKKRALGLYQIDQKKEIRLAHQNPIVKNVYQNFPPDQIKKVSSTYYLKKSKGQIYQLKNSLRPKKFYA